MYRQTLYGCGLFIALEVFWPRSVCSPTSRLRGAVLYLVSGAAFAISSAVFAAGFEAAQLRPLFALPLDAIGPPHAFAARNAAWIIAPFVIATIDDFFFYWLHRAYHAYPPLWRVHKIHHAVRELSALNSAAHIGEGVLRIPFVALPMALLFHFDVGYAPSIAMVLIGIHGYFNHSCTRLNLGPLRYFVSDNRFHRIHHSMEPSHQDRNFGNYTTIWDQLFGTAYFPRPDEWPEAGLAEIGERKRFEIIFLSAAPYLPPRPSMSLQFRTPAIKVRARAV